MKNETCKTCRFWLGSCQAPWDDTYETGRCANRSPVADERDGRAVWPYTHESDWCGGYIMSRELVEELQAEQEQ